MRVLFLTNNPITYPLLEWLREREDVLLWEDRLFPDVVEDLKPDFVVSYNYRYIIGKDAIRMFDRNRIVNLHISLLPWNRGMHPNVWSFVEDTPKGVTIHVVDEGIDTGDILLQKEVHIDESVHTLRSSYELLHREIQNLFRENWEDIKSGRITPKPQVGKGTFHTRKDFERIRPLLSEKGWDIPIPEFKERVRRLLR